MLRVFQLVTLTTLLTTLLAACLPAPTAGVRALNFQASESGGEIDPKMLLTAQKVPRDKLMTLKQAMQAAPIGSLMVVCWNRLESPWSPCSHLTRKFSQTTLTDVVLFGERIREYPLSHMYPRYAVIVLDTGVTEEMLPAMQARARQLEGQYYNLSGAPDTYYCTPYQNALDLAMGLPPSVPFNGEWNAYLPADILYNPAVKVRFVGVNPEVAGASQ